MTSTDYEMTSTDYESAILALATIESENARQRQRIAELERELDDLDAWPPAKRIKWLQKKVAVLEQWATQAAEALGPFAREFHRREFGSSDILKDMNIGGCLLTNGDLHRAAALLAGDASLAT